MIARALARLLATWGLWLAGLLALSGYGGMVGLDAAAGTLRGEFTSQTVVWYLLAFAGFLVALWWNERRPIPLVWLWVLPIAFRVLLLATTPTLSDDVYRYLWDGHLAVEGVNPYMYAIEAPELDVHEIPARTLANNPSLGTPYLPTAQLVFATSALLFPADPLVMQVVMVGFDLLTAVVVWLLLGLVGLPGGRIILYLWNPLVIVEVAHGAHLDALMVFLTMSAVLLTFKRLPRRTDWAAPALLALATLTRLIPALVLPVLWWRWRWLQRLVYAAVAIAVLLPFGLDAGWGLFGESTGTGLFGSTRVYAREFSFNSGIFHWIEGWADGRGVGDPAAFARLLVGAVLGAVVVAVFVRARKTGAPLASLRLMAIPVMAYVLLTPILHPWYMLLLLALLPFLTPTRSESRRYWLLVVPWLYLSGALVFSYLTYRDPLQFGELEWIRRLEWYPTLLLLAIVIGLLAASAHPTLRAYGRDRLRS